MVKKIDENDLFEWTCVSKMDTEELKEHLKNNRKEILEYISEYTGMYIMVVACHIQSLIERKPTKEEIKRLNGS